MVSRMGGQVARAARILGGFGSALAMTLCFALQLLVKMSGLSYGIKAIRYLGILYVQEVKER